RIHSVVFTGNQAVSSEELNSALKTILANGEYTDRRFASAVEMNLRPVYEKHGFYRVAFTPQQPAWVESGVSVNVAITEGAPYRLGKVELIGEDLSLDAMLSAGKFPKEKLANWQQIQEGIWEMEKVVKRTGFLDATASPERSYDDVAHVLHLRVPIQKGPL